MISPAGLRFQRTKKRKPYLSTSWALSFNELGVPENLRRLSVHLRKLAIQQTGR
jgi:hypothetical protein